MSKGTLWICGLWVLSQVVLAAASGVNECPVLPFRQGNFDAPEREEAAPAAVAGGVSNREAAELRVVSLNIAGETSATRVFDDLLRLPDISMGDVYLLQEVDEIPGQSSNVVADLAEKSGFHFVFAPAQQREDGRLHGLGLLSRFPFSDVAILPLPRFDLNYRTRCRIALAATVHAPGGSVRLFNLHLDTRINSDKRLEQLQPVLESARSFQGPAIVGGDLNTGDVYWVQHMVPVPFVHRQSRKLRESLELQGFVTPFSETGKTHAWAPLKLDWIFLKGMASVDHGLEKIPFSDHRALWTQLKFEPPG